MTTARRDLALDRAVTAFKNGEADCDGVTYATGINIHNSECCVRAGLAAALPHLADACGALRAAERSRVSTPTPEPITAVSGNLSGLQGHSAPTHNPTHTTQED